MATPDDMADGAEAIVTQLLALPETQKDSTLRQLKQDNPVLHALVLAKLKDLR